MTAVFLFFRVTERLGCFSAERNHEQVPHTSQFHLAAHVEGNSNPYASLQSGFHPKQYPGDVEPGILS